MSLLHTLHVLTIIMTTRDATIPFFLGPIRYQKIWVSADTNPIPVYFFQCRISILLYVDLIVTLLCVKHDLLQYFSTGGSKVLQPQSWSRDCSEWVVAKVGLGDMAQKIITIIFSYQSISIIITINVKSLFLSSLKPDFCSKVKVLETRPLIFLNTILI